MFRIVSRLFGFSVEQDDGFSVTVDLEPWALVLQNASRRIERLGIPDEEGLVDAVCAGLRRRKQGKYHYIRP